MVSVTVDNPLGFWVVDTTQIRDIFTWMKPCLTALQEAGYTDCRAGVGGGVHERDTGYEDFFHKYASFADMEEHLCDDFSNEEAELDGLWFNTLNFEYMTVGLEKGVKKGTLTYSRGEMTLRLDADEEALERRIQAVLEPFRYPGNRELEL